MKNDGCAVASLVLGILALIFSFIPGLGWLAIVTGVVGLILAVVGKNRIKANPQELGGSGIATAGLVLNIITLVLELLTLIACSAFMSALS
ncbi:MAG: hypothetical protein JG776_2052 [Caloramator sp.]|uniref:DUF4190 domain-containing protein n=1 Tax=Caloramator sp. TaxID=1871330 RepID=UPI001DDAE2A8|nr:DUF4190 domain-containing protein [Caloramator sp.]MBZ4664334.1 hypothetical protein [Caloramator sp.]